MPADLQSAHIQRKLDYTDNILTIGVVKSSKKVKGEEKPPDKWPFIRWAEKEKAWKVDAGTKAGGIRRFFSTKAKRMGGHPPTPIEEHLRRREPHAAGAFEFIHVVSCVYLC
jgi:hypothetical protein